MQTIGILSDTHIPRTGSLLPSEVISTFKDAHVSLIIHAGDFEDLSFINDLQEIAPVRAVHGNMCNSDVRSKYPAIDTLRVEELTIGITHGYGGPEGFYDRILNIFKNFKNLDIIICGHTHKPEAFRVGEKQKIQIINPGSPTDKKFSKENTIVLLTIEERKYDVRFIVIS